MKHVGEHEAGRQLRYFERETERVLMSVVLHHCFFPWVLVEYRGNVYRLVFTLIETEISS